MWPIIRRIRSIAVPLGFALSCALAVASCNRSSTLPAQIPTTAVPVPFVAEHTLYSFFEPAYPHGALIALGKGGFSRKFDLWGTTVNGSHFRQKCGANQGCGNAFSIDMLKPEGESSIELNGHSGAYPHGGLVYLNGGLFGTAEKGGSGCGAVGCGTIFVIPAPFQQMNVLHYFNGNDGAQPYGSLIARAGRELWGTTISGGLHGRGTAFGIDQQTGKEIKLYSFKGTADDGAYPHGELLAYNGKLYGTTVNGGIGCFPKGCGTVFELDPASGVERAVYRFDGPDGAYPYAGLVEVNGRLWGTTANGGGNCSPQGCGTVFAIDPSTHKQTQLYRFAGAEDGAYPNGSLIFVAGELWGTTVNGGVDACNHGCGTVFALTLVGEHRVVYRFKGGANGAFPYASLFDFKGNLYGTTQKGGNVCDCGTVFWVGPVYQPLPSPSPSPSPTAAPTPTASPSPTPMPTPSLTPTPRPTPSATPTSTPTPNPGKFFARAMSLHPLAYYRLDATGGTVVADSSGNGFTGTLAGSAKLGVPGLLAGDTDKAIDLTGGSIALPVMTAHKQFTLIALVRSANYALPRALVGYYGNFLSISGGKLQWCATFTGACAGSLSPALTSGKAYILAVTVSISSNVAQVRCSTNGAALVDCNRARFGSNALFASGNFLGRSPFFPNFPGTLDESIVYPKVLAPSDIAALAKIAGY
jgi:uncharacterized repeat protein (TIGR03803 family)